MSVLSSPLSTIKILSALCLMAAGDAFAQTSPPFPVPPPQPVAPVPPQPRPSPAQFLPGPPDITQFAHAFPRLEVWRSGSDTPQLRERDANGRTETVLIADADDPVTLLVRFEPVLVGRRLLITVSRGIVVVPATNSVVIPSNAEVALQISFEASQGSGQIVLDAEKIRTVVPLIRVPLAVLIAQEEAAKRTIDHWPGPRSFFPSHSRM